MIDKINLTYLIVKLYNIYNDFYKSVFDYFFTLLF